MTLDNKKSPPGTMKPPPGVKIAPEPRDPNYVDPETLQDRFEHWKKKQQQPKKP
jgi:hypothetical protein